MTSAPSTLTTSGISLTDLEKSFGAVRAVRRRRPRHRARRDVAILGPNGAGKSTTIDMLLGLCPPDRGRVSLFGMTPADGRRRRRDRRDAANRLAHRPAHDPRARDADRVAVPAPASRRRRAGDHRSRRHRRPAHREALRRPDPTASASPSRSSPTPICSCSTSRPSRSTSRAATRSGRRCAASPAAARPWSSPRTTSKRPTRSPTASCSWPTAAIVADGSTTEIKARVGMKTIRATLPDAPLDRLRRAAPASRSAERHGETVDPHVPRLRRRAARAARASSPTRATSKCSAPTSKRRSSRSPATRTTDTIPQEAVR